jgi:hypothetical protein
MKLTIGVVIVTLLTMLTTAQGQVCDGDFSTQTEVDNFIIENPDCTTLGFLNVQHSETDPILNLDGLRNITSVLSDVDAYQSTVLDFSGLDNIREIGILFLDRWITNDSTYARFESLERVESFYLWDSDLKEYDGLANLCTVVDEAEVRDNDSLATLSFFSAIEDIGLSLIVDNNQSLSAIVGFDSPRFIWPAGRVEVTNNPQLNDCEVWGFCQFIQDYVTRIENNGAGCEITIGWTDYCPYGYLAVEGDSNTCTSMASIDIDEPIDPSSEPYTIADEYNRVFTVLHPLENILGTTTFDIFNASDLPSANVPYCQRRHSIIPEAQPSDSVYVRFYYSTEEVLALMDADPNIRSIDDLRISVALGACDDDLGEVVATFTPTHRKVLRDSVSFTFDIMASTLGTFYLHGPQDLLLSNTDEARHKLNVYPNPVIDRLFVSVNEVTSYRILDLSARLVQMGTVSDQGAIDMSRLGAGMYVLELGGGQLRQRVLKL